MTNIACNCIICSNEFNSEELQSIALSKINVTNFKVCQSCLDNSDPEEDYREVRSIVNSYLKFASAEDLFEDAKSILDSIKL